MALAYGITAAISLFMIGVCVAADKKRDIWLMLLFVSVSVCNLGYFMLSVSRNLEGALTSNRIAYLGSVFLPYFMLMMVLRFCRIKRGRGLMLTLGLLGVAMLTITTSPGILPIYYKTVDFQIVDGAAVLLRTYGPLHKLYYLYLFGYMLSMVGVAVYALIKRRIRTSLHTALLLCAVLCNIVIWLVEQLLPRGFEWLSVSYILTECFILGIYRSMQKQGLMEKEGKQVSYGIDVLLSLYALLLASFIRVVTQNTSPAIYISAHIAVLLIYLNLLIFWGISFYDRLVNLSIRRYLMVIVVMMMVWILARTLRFTVFFQVYPGGLWCWYACYIPMILIPQLCFFAAKHMGQPESYRLPKNWYLLYIPSALLILGILTNNLHQLAFSFPQGSQAGWYSFEPGILYYGALVWVFLFIGLMIARFVRQCRIPGTKKVIWLPVAMLAVGVIYAVLYTLNSDLFGFIEMTAALCLMVIAIWESCIKTGLVQSNTHYNELLRYSGLGVAVVDSSYAVHYRSEDALALTPEQMQAARKEPLLLPNGIRVSAAPIRGGFSLYQEDVSELLQGLEELAQLQEDLQDANAVSMQNYQMDKKLHALEEQNRLHDQLHRQTSSQIDRLNDWLEQLLKTADKQTRRELLRRIVVVGAYLKRRNNLILLSEQQGAIQEEEFLLSIQEIMRSALLADIRCACSVRFGRELPTAAAMELLDAYEYVIENAFDGLSSLLARFFCRDGDFYACIDTVCSLDLTALASGRIRIDKAEENYYTLSVCVKGGEETL